MLDNMIDLWAKKSLDEKVYNYCQVNKNHILSIDFEDDIQINLINGERSNTRERNFNQTNER